MPAGKRPGFSTFGPITNWRSTRADDVSQFSGEEFSPFVDTFIAAVLILTPVSEEFGGTIQAVTVEEVGADVATLVAPFVSSPSSNEEFSGAHPTEEVPVSTSAVFDVPLILASVQEEFPVAPVVTPSLEETGLPPGLIPNEQLTAISRPEDFAGSLPLEETALPQTFSEPVWISWSIGEEFGGARPTEEAAFLPALIPSVWLTTTSAPEDFAGSLPLEEASSPQTIAQQVWLSWSVSEEIAGAHPTEESGGIFALAETQDRQSQQAATEEFAGSLPLEEVSSQQALTQPVWITWSAGEEEFGSAHPAEDFGAFVFTRVDLPIQFQSSTEDVFSGSLPLEEPSNAQSIAEAIWITWLASEEFSGSLPLEEASSPQTIIEQGWVSWSVSGEEFGSAHPTEDVGPFVFTRVDTLAQLQSSTEDVFAGSLPLEEPSSTQSFVEPVWISWSIVEDFAGSLPLEESAPTQTLLEPVQSIQIWSSVAEAFEGFAGSLPLEEATAPQSFVEPVWISWSVAEDFAGSLPLEEISLTQTLLESVQPGQIWSVAEALDGFAGSLPFEESSSFVLTRVDLQTLFPVAVLGFFGSSEEFVGQVVPPPPPPPPGPVPVSRAIVPAHISGSGFVFSPEVIDTEGELVCDPVFTEEDLRCTAELAAVKSLDPMVQAWARQRVGEKKGRAAAETLLREVQVAPFPHGTAPLARVSWFAATAKSIGFEVVLVGHWYGPRLARPLTAVRVDGDWHYADPDPHDKLPLGSTATFSRAEFFEVEMARAGPRPVAYQAPMRLSWVGKTAEKPVVIVRKTGVPAVFFVAALALVLLLIVAREDRE
jgi:hypothetical protein